MNKPIIADKIVKIDYTMMVCMPLTDSWINGTMQYTLLKGLNRGKKSEAGWSLNIQYWIVEPQMTLNEFFSFQVGTFLKIN